MEQQEIRSKFPVFSQNKRLVYLDNAATSQKPEGVIDRVRQFYLSENSNIHRGNYPLSSRASEYYAHSKQTVSHWIDARTPEEIVYTKSSTEAINLVAAGMDGLTGPENNIVTTELEHSSNYFPWKELCRRTGVQFRVAEVEEDGSLKTEKLLKLIDCHTKLVAVTGMSNAGGFCPDLKKIISEAHNKGALVLVDATQLIVHRMISVRELDCDFLSFSSHKIYGPMGLGVLYGKQSCLELIPPLLYGGDMVLRGDGDQIIYKSNTEKFEGGTQNIGGALGLEAAIEFLQENEFEALLEHEKALAAYTRQRLEKIKGLHILNSGPDSPIILFEMDGIGAYDVGVLLGLKDIAVRCGSHCAYPLMKRLERQSLCRVSLAVYNTKEDSDRLAAALEGLNSLRKL
ncbi:aminotransferase class V-fold PLP-dependent enzyme [Enterocloster sp.]|uniref:aminotransferase class V-fold PLP-dependent enzyme n=1 Tax=Enterocloster sp. TaxID=2719315 RepID=UPI003AB46ECC